MIFAQCLATVLNDSQIFKAVEWLATVCTTEELESDRLRGQEFVRFSNRTEAAKGKLPLIQMVEAGE